MAGEGNKDTQDLHPDKRIRALIETWEVPTHSPALDERVMAAYDRRSGSTIHRATWSQLFKRLFTMSFPIPISALPVVALLFFIWGMPLLQSSNIIFVEKLPSTPPPPEIVHIPVVQERVVIKPIYIEKAGRGSQQFRSGTNSGDLDVIDNANNSPTLPRANDDHSVTPADPKTSTDNGVRQFTLNDVNLSMNNFRLLINGQLAASGEKTGDSRTGPLLWFYLTGRGRYIFSITPLKGYQFQNIGLIENNKISFSLDGDLYEWISSSPIVGNGGNWQIWVLRDSNYRPDFEVNYLIGAADSIDFLLPK
jgi:hypothetical protein